LLLYLLQRRDPYGQSKSISKVQVPFDTPYMQCLRPRVGVFFSGFQKNFEIFIFRKLQPQADGPKLSRYPALQTGQGWAKPSPQGHGLDADAGHTDH